MKSTQSLSLPYSKQHEATKRRILKSAKSLLLAHGFSTVNMAMIAGQLQFKNAGKTMDYPTDKSVFPRMCIAKKEHPLKEEILSLTPANFLVF